MPDTPEDAKPDNPRQHNSLPFKNTPAPWTLKMWTREYPRESDDEWEEEDEFYQHWFTPFIIANSLFSIECSIEFLQFLTVLLWNLQFFEGFPLTLIIFRQPLALGLLSVHIFLHFSNSWVSFSSSNHKGQVLSAYFQAFSQLFFLFAIFSGRGCLLSFEGSILRPQSCELFLQVRDNFGVLNSALQQVSFQFANLLHQFYNIPFFSLKVSFSLEIKFSRCGCHSKNCSFPSPS